MNNSVKEKVKNKNNLFSIGWVLSLFETLIIPCCFAIFIIQATFFALNIKENLPPDELYHVELSQIYSKSLGVPENSEKTYFLGEIAHIPFLYHWLAGRIINIKNYFIPNIEDFIVLRAFSVFTGIVNLILAYQIIKLLTKEKLVHILLMIMMSNTLMFVFISGSASYDPLSVFFPLLTILFGLKLVKLHSIYYAFFFFISIFLGALTKVTFLPFAVVSVVILVINEFKYRKSYLKQILYGLSKRKSRILIILIFLFCSFLVYLNLGLYITNLSDYKSVRPNCAVVMGRENCMKNLEFQNYYELEANAPPKSELLSFYLYLPHWIYLMIDRTFGIFTNLKMGLSYNGFTSYFLVFLLSLLFFIRTFDRNKFEHIFFSLLITVYLLILMLFTNYQMYLSNGIIHAAVQGRYIFPILVPIYSLVSLSLLSLKNKYLRILIIFVVSLIFIFGNIPFFIQNVTEEWFIPNSMGSSIIISIKDTIHNIYIVLKNCL